MRIDRRLQGRIDPSDVIQEAYLEAVRRFPEYERQKAAVSLFIWLRFLTAQQLQILHRHHLGTQARNAARDVSLDQPFRPEASSQALADVILGRDTRASEALIRAERSQRLLKALEELEPIDREILSLRHFEQLSNGECAQELGLSEAAATKRHIRALKRLRGILSLMPGGTIDFES